MNKNYQISDNFLVNFLTTRLALRFFNTLGLLKILSIYFSNFSTTSSGDNNSKGSSF